MKQIFCYHQYAVSAVLSKLSNQVKLCLFVLTLGKTKVELIYMFLFSSWKPFEFNPEQVRVLLFRECESRRRKVLFDSCSVHKVPVALEKSAPNGKPNSRFGTAQKNETKKTDPEFVEVTNGYGYKVSTIIKLLGLYTCRCCLGTARTLLLLHLLELYLH